MYATCGRSGFILLRNGVVFHVGVRDGKISASARDVDDVAETLIMKCRFLGRYSLLNYGFAFTPETIAVQTDDFATAVLLPFSTRAPEALRGFVRRYIEQVLTMYTPPLSWSEAAEVIARTPVEELITNNFHALALFVNGLVQGNADIRYADGKLYFGSVPAENVLRRFDEGFMNVMAIYSPTHMWSNALARSTEVNQLRKAILRAHCDLVFMLNEVNVICSEGGDKSFTQHAEINVWPLMSLTDFKEELLGAMLRAWVMVHYPPIEMGSIDWPDIEVVRDDPEPEKILVRLGIRRAVPPLVAYLIHELRLRGYDAITKPVPLMALLEVLGEADLPKSVSSALTKYGDDFAVTLARIRTGGEAGEEEVKALAKIIEKIILSVTTHRAVTITREEAELVERLTKGYEPITAISGPGSSSADTRVKFAGSQVIYSIRNYHKRKQLMAAVTNFLNKYIARGTWVVSRA